MSLFTILYIADVCGKAGRQACAHMIKPLRAKYDVDYVVANVENAAGGFGITPEMSIKAFSYGIDMQVSGNHIWDRVAILEYFERSPKLLRPANYPLGAPGRGSYVDSVGDVKVGVINLQGRTYMKEIDCPFQVGRREVESVSKQTAVILVDFHAEATSEKQAMAYYLNGKVSAVIGSHTHVQTVDDHITLRGTAYLTDAGMTGPHDSIIGMEKGPALGRFLTGMPKRFTTATDDIKLSGAVVRVDPETGRAEHFERLRLDFDITKFKPEDIQQDV
ncbi:MAG: TIGR00282 family metallophosphoesterase [candidate division Zixibacteria bacterium]|nr:TIGR00282 family metallophosphoesterase [candidate division Zixibacteria bacterium]MDH3937902.1 TIGR00282 family metallophosphoesterase [candidate division Zixibacteria bacterium]MDH4034033.1 TIGR00282 family metallophosphoesterase [candidate division Zixibacteria bacterium]